MSKNRKIFAAILMMAFVTAAGCSSKNMSSGQSGSGYASAPAAAAPMAPPAAMPEMARTDGLSNNMAYDSDMEEARDESGQKQDAKIIITAYMQMSTDRFDEVSNAVRVITEQSGGYVQDSNMNVNSYYDRGDYREMRITLRVPADRYADVFENIKALGVVQSANESQENVTQQYYDLQARLKTKRIEEERLLELINKATKIEDILRLEELLGNVRMEIEVYESQINNIDRLSSYSTITLHLTEVLDEKEVIVPSNFGSRIKLSFVKSLNMTISFFENAVVLLATIIVPLFVLLVFAVITWSLFRLARLRRNGKG